MIYDRLDAIPEMDRLGMAKIPFFFFTDWLGTSAWIKPLDAIATSELEFDFSCQQPARMSKPSTFQKDPIAYKEFLQDYQYITDQINLGNSYLTNLTYQTPITTNLTLNEIYRHAQARYKVRYRDDFVVFSPETFISTKSGQIYSFPMKGTINATLPGARDILLSDPKEAAEHVTIVDLIRNDLSLVAEAISVPGYREVVEVHTNGRNLLQTISKIKGNLLPPFQKSPGSLLFQLLPAGSISGAPKAETIRIIQRAERYDRGYYTGVCGCFDGTDLESAVMIRFIERQGSDLYYKSGGGITSFSDPKKEYQEMIDKVYLPIIQ